LLDLSVCDDISDMERLSAAAVLAGFTSRCFANTCSTHAVAARHSTRLMHYSVSRCNTSSVQVRRDVRLAFC